MVYIPEVITVVDYAVFGFGKTLDLFFCQKANSILM
jgi:hypothetical protein